MKLLLPLLLLALLLAACSRENPVIVTPSGLQIEELEEGNGAEVRGGATVILHYTGWLTDGTKFDSSLDRGEPFKFTMGVHPVIPGWDEGIAMMRAGGKWKLSIPPELAYGERGIANIIPPGATLVFEVEVLEVR